MLVLAPIGGASSIHWLVPCSRAEARREHRVGPRSLRVAAQGQVDIPFEL